MAKYATITNKPTTNRMNRTKGLKYPINGIFI